MPEASIAEIAASLASTLNPAAPPVAPPVLPVVPPIATPGAIPAAVQPIAPAVLTQPPAMPAMPVAIPLPPERYQSFLQMEQEFHQMKLESRQREAAANEEKARLLAEKGHAIEAVNLLKEDSRKAVEAEQAQRAVLEQRARRYARDGELARALNSHNLVGPHAAAQLTTLFGSQLEAYPEGDSFIVRTPTYKSATEFVNEQLARAEYAHFVAPRNPQGGTGASPGAATTIPTPPAVATPPAQAHQPRNIGEAMMMDKIAAKLTPTGVNPNTLGASIVNEQGIVVPVQTEHWGLKPLPGAVGVRI